ncbi:hypothetical protein M9H77_34239 [Catharanthus roseus]|uniref:Uncharacterized protein n=1 Tax=Catharanthus roseus TaxID=4058 RepID=A0ACB9ZLG8_CATRO|nr:hypothetical protein M9H77_34239 [Catharanthus roseus]
MLVLRSTFAWMGKNPGALSPRMAKILGYFSLSGRKFEKLEEYIDLEYLFTTDRIFSSKDELKSRTADRRSYITLSCERGWAVKKYTKPVVDDEEEEIPTKRRGPYGTKKCGCPFKLKGEQMLTSKNWQLFVHNGRHNHKIDVYYHGHAQAARFMEQLQQTEQFKKSHVPPRNIL